MENVPNIQTAEPGRNAANTFHCNVAVQDHVDWTIDSGCGAKDQETGYQYTCRIINGDRTTPRMSQSTPPGPKLVAFSPVVRAFN